MKFYVITKKIRRHIGHRIPFLINICLYFYYFSMLISSTSKIKVEKGLILPASREP